MELKLKLYLLKEIDYTCSIIIERIIHKLNPSIYEIITKNNLTLILVLKNIIT
jgi:hypothetical protein